MVRMAMQAKRAIFGLALAGVAVWTSLTLAQQPAPTTRPADELVTLSFPESVELRVLADYVSRRTGTTFLYTDEVAAQKITIRAAAPIPASSLVGLLQSAAQIRGLMVVDSDQPGIKKIVTAANAAPGARASAITQVYFLQHVDAQAADQIIKLLLTQPGGNSIGIPQHRLLVVSDYATNIERIGAVIAKIDEGRKDIAVEFFRLEHADAQQIAPYVSQILTARLNAQGGPMPGAGPAEVVADARTNQIAIVGPRSQMVELGEIVRKLDIPLPPATSPEASPIRFYKLANTTAADVLETIRNITAEPESSGPASRLERSDIYRRSRGNPGRANPLIPPAGQPKAATGPTSRPTQMPVEPSGGMLAFQTDHAKVTADTNTNSIIVVGSPIVQQTYEQLIRSLDKRRPQVMIECILVTLDTSDNFSLGVEISKTGGFDRNQVLTFSSFGLSAVDPFTGRLSIIPGTGFNGALISTDIADVVIRALTANNRAKVISAPRILVNDNATGTLSSVAESPFTSINTAIGTISTTTFAGYAEAGTQITLTPHISDADYLQLEYTVAVNRFTGNSNDGIPPPRQTDAVESSVTIPDGSTIVVGGLNRRNERVTKQAVPVLGEIPLLEYLFSNRVITNEQTTLFVFLRPIILRDDRFKDLKNLSQQDVRKAGVKGDAPESLPVLMK